MKNLEKSLEKFNQIICEYSIMEIDKLDEYCRFKLIDYNGKYVHTFFAKKEKWKKVLDLLNKNFLIMFETNKEARDKVLEIFGPNEVKIIEYNYTFFSLQSFIKNI